MDRLSILGLIAGLASLAVQRIECMGARVGWRRLVAGGLQSKQRAGAGLGSCPRAGTAAPAAPAAQPSGWRRGHELQPCQSRLCRTRQRPAIAERGRFRRARPLVSVLRARAQKPVNPIFQEILQQQFVDNSRNLMVNAPNSSVTVGSNNIVSQHVTTSTATSPTGNATASAGVGTARRHSGTKQNSVNQTATSTATSTGGTAQAVAINTDVSPRATP